MIWLLLLPVLLSAHIDISAERMLGKISSRQVSFKKFRLESPDWSVRSKTARTINDCIIISGNAVIQNKKTGDKYFSNRFNFCPKQNLLKSLDPVKIVKGKLVINSKQLELNIKTNIAKLTSIKAQHE